MAFQNGTETIFDSSHSVSVKLIALREKKGGIIMAIYHFSVQAISRGKGQSAVASASYRSGEKLQDERTGETKFYKREVMPDSMILSPENAPEWVQDRQRLWNEVEKMESNKNSRLAREINVALPVELSHGQQKELIKDYAKEQFVDKGMVVDISIHRDDPNNPHAHIMLTIRPFDKEGEWVKQKSKKENILDKEGNFTYNKNGNKRTRKIDLIGWDKKELVQDWRKEWSNHANKMLEREGGKERIDHRSHADKELETKPTQHLGYKASAMEKDGKETERGNYNREIESYNQTVIDLQEYREAKQQLEREQARQKEQKAKTEKFTSPVERTQLESAAKLLKGEPTLEKINQRLKQINGWAGKIDRNYKALEQKDADFKAINDHLFGISSSQNRIKANQEKLDSVGTFKGLTKDGKRTKQSAESEIQKHESNVKEHERKLIPYTKVYGFNNESGFKAIYQKYQDERPKLHEDNGKQRSAIKRELDVLQKAKSALENHFVREVASRYPNNPEMSHMNYKTAKSIDMLNKKHDKTLSVDEIKQMRNSFKKDFQSANKQINHAVSENDRLDKVEGYLKGYYKANTVVEKYENNPIYRGNIGKGKLSKTDKQIYENALSERQRYGQLLKQHHLKDTVDLYQQKESLEQSLNKLPQIQQQADFSQKGAGLFDGIVQGIEQAQRQMEQQYRQQTKIKNKQKQKYKQKGIGEIELG